MIERETDTWCSPSTCSCACDEMDQTSLNFLSFTFLMHVGMAGEWD